jgi:hypothetical protein
VVLHRLHADIEPAGRLGDRDAGGHKAKVVLADGVGNRGYVAAVIGLNAK